jgi:hypothetical protein
MSVPNSPQASPSQPDSASDDGEESDPEGLFLNPAAKEAYVRPSKRKGRGTTGRTNSPRRSMAWSSDESILLQSEDEAEVDAALNEYKKSISLHPWQPDFARKGTFVAIDLFIAIDLLLLACDRFVAHCFVAPCRC